MTDMERRVSRMEDAQTDVRLARIETQMDELRRASDRSYSLNITLLTCVIPLLLELGVRIVKGKQGGT